MSVKPAKPAKSAQPAKPIKPAMKIFRLLSAFAAFVAALASGLAFAPRAAADSPLSLEQAFAFQAVSHRFTDVPTMSGDFIQFEPNGRQSEGRFFIKRPGKARFDYNQPSPLLIKVDGLTVGIHNRDLETWDYYPLRTTPLSLLLAKKIDVSDESIKSVTLNEDLIIIDLADETLFGNSRISMMFDPISYDLRQWTITDSQGKQTTVVIHNVQRGENLTSNLFSIDRGAPENQDR